MDTQGERHMSRAVLIGLTFWFTSMFVDVFGMQQQSQAGNIGVYDVVPQADRSSLQESVGKMIELQKQERWEEIYDWLPESAKKEVSREEFARRSSKRSRLASFEPTETVTHPTEANEWLVLGCGVFTKGSTTRGLQSVIYARVLQSKWSLSTVMIVGPERGHPKPCDVQSPASRRFSKGFGVGQSGFSVE
jgi:hypothetical protein